MKNIISLETASTAFNHWRMNRSSTRGRIPLALQKQAIDLLQSYSKSQVIKALKINHAMLKRWQQEATTATCDFISLTTEPSLSTQPSLQITLRNANGGELTITGISLSQVSTLATEFTAGDSL